jgi:hypothetical protein
MTYTGPPTSSRASASAGKTRQRHRAYLVGFTDRQIRNKRTGKVHEAPEFFIWERRA